MNAKKTETKNETAVAVATDPGEVSIVEKFPALSSDSEMREVIEANYGAEPMKVSDLISVPTPSGGGTKWIFEDVDGEQEVEELAGLLVYYGVAGVLWASDDPSPGSIPYLQTSDLKWAHKIDPNADPGDLDPELIEQAWDDDQKAYDWEKLHYNQWGSGKKSIGKRCQELRNMCILREGELMPLLFRCKPGSLADVSKFIKRLSAKMVPYYRTVIGLKLEKAQSRGGITFSKVVPRKIAEVPKELKPMIGNMTELGDEAKQRTRALGALIEDTRKLVTEMTGAVHTVNTELQQMPELVNRMQLLLESTDRTLEGVQRLWPLSSAIKPGTEEMVIKEQPVSE